MPPYIKDIASKYWLHHTSQIIPYNKATCMTMCVDCSSDTYNWNYVVINVDLHTGKA